VSTTASGSQTLTTNPALAPDGIPLYLLQITDDTPVAVRHQPPVSQA
jgi:hypothetical protein